MSRHFRTHTQALLATWPSIAVEGGIIAPAMLEKIHQLAAPETDEQSYGLRKGLRLQDEIPLAFRVAQRHYEDFRRWNNRSREAVAHFAQGLLREAFAFDDLEYDPHAAPEAPMLMAGNGRIPVFIAPATGGGDKRRDPLNVAAAHLQKYLNEHEEALWGLVTDSGRVRLMRDNASLVRPAYVEANLRAMLENEDAASFHLLWLLIHRSRFGHADAPVADCALERWREEGLREGVAARDRLAGQVRQALEVLGTGFLQANPDLAERLQKGEEKLQDWFNELLRLVYRLIFLMVAEDRDLLHPPESDARAREIYRKGYSLSMLRRQCLRAATWDAHFDRYEGLKIVFTALGGRGEQKLALPALGGLFTPTQLPTLEDARLSNRALMEAIYRLAWLQEREGRLPVNWRDMKTEELGSVYESLLELQPQLTEGGRRFTFATEAAETRGNQRKTTGSYYTPDSLVQALLDTALAPVLNEAEAQPDPEKALLNLKVIDPACGSGHFLIAAAHRMADRLARIRSGGQPGTSLQEYRHALRDVARHCLFGVDRNPMAVELARVALWIETVEPGKPLGFLDANIRCGDSLLGVFDLSALEKGVPDDAYKPLSGDDKAVAKYYLQKNRREKKDRARRMQQADMFERPETDLLEHWKRLRTLPEDTPEQVAEKQRQLVQLQGEGGPYWRLKTAGDMYVAAFLLPKRRDPDTFDGLPQRGREIVPTSGAIWEYLRGVTPLGSMVGVAQDAARDAHAFHWPLEFADIMAAGGFDVVLGNPPWERIKLQEKEFFAARAPEIANAPNKAARDRLIAEYAEKPAGTPERQLYDDFIAARHLAEAISTFMRVPAREGGRFPYTGTGDVNTYALFAELFSQLAKNRAGVIVPTGIATDATTAPFFAHLVAEHRLASLFDFENRERLFPAVDSRMKFCLLTLGREVERARFAFFLTEPGQLMDARRVFSLSPAQIARINPNTKTAPVFRSRADAELTAMIYERVPVLIHEGKGEAGNPWGVRFMRMFDMSNDSHLFRTTGQLEEAGFSREGTDWVKDGERYVPLYEAKMIHQFDHRWATYEEKKGKLVTRDVTAEEKADPAFEPMPRYWVPEAEVRARLLDRNWRHEWLMGWRDIARSTDERTTISSIIPNVGVGDKYLLMFPIQHPDVCACLVANMNALVADFCARQKLGGTSFKYFTMKQMAYLSPAFFTPERLSFITERALELLYTSLKMQPLAQELGFDGPPFPWDEARRALLRAELDAFFAKAYGLNRKQLRYILDPADLTPPEVADILSDAEEVTDPLDEDAYQKRTEASDYPSETFRVLKNNELKRFGEYRTRRLVLEAWQQMEADGTFTHLGL